MADVARSPRPSSPHRAALLLLAILLAQLHAGASFAQQAPAWIGNVKSPTGLPGVPGGYGPYHVGRGGATPGTDLNGMWTWDSDPGPDSLQGWWPIVRAYATVAGSNVPDFKRPWWALDYGNQANYAIPQGLKRTFGVVGVWHRDAGALVSHPSVPAATPAWQPLAGGYSAWMGLRAEGDNAVVDPITGNPFNQTVLAYNGENTGVASGTAKNFPGYGSQMDQMLYRDFDLLGAPGASLNVTFGYRTAMSTGIDTADSTRTGWFQHDPLQPTDGVVNQAPGNFISSSDAGDLAAPRDSFMVYIGAPTGPTFIGSDGLERPIYDPLRRWFSETIRSVEGLYREIFSVAGSDSGSASITVPYSVLAPILSASGGRVRLVFRVKTNRGFDDQDGAFTSYGRGAAQVDVVTYAAGSLTSPPGWGDFESAGSIDNAPGVSPLSAWKSTGKPPQAFAHTEPLANLPFSPNDPATCDMAGGVISAGSHDDFESIPNGFAGSAQAEWMQGIVSPAVNLVSPGPGSYNGMGIDAALADATLDYFLRYEVYTGAVDLPNTGISVTVGVQCFPVLQSNGVRSWSDLRTLTRTLDGPPHECLTVLEPLRADGLIHTSNASGIPDSLRVCLAVQTRRFAVGQPPSSQDGVYFDNVSLGFLDLSFAQLDFKSDAGVFVDSELGEFSVDMTPATQAAFVNVVARVPGEASGGWVVRNLFVPPAADAQPQEPIATEMLMLDLVGVSPGQPVPGLEYDMRITNFPLTDSAAAAWLPYANWRGPVPVADDTVEVGGFDETGLPPPSSYVPPFHPPFLPPIDVDIISWLGCKVPNIDLDDSARPGEHNGCGPASVANSMRWLDDEHDEIAVPELRQAFNQLSDLMNRLAGQGVSTEEIIRAKLDFIEGHQLPIHVKFQSKVVQGDIASKSGRTHATNEGGGGGGWPTAGWMMSESAAGEDVELGGGFYYFDGTQWKRDGGHAVVLTGSGFINGIPWVAYKHDRKQKVAGGTKQELSPLDTTGGFVTIPGLGGMVRDPNGNWYRAHYRLETVFSESYDPDAGGGQDGDEPFDEYCDWFFLTLGSHRKVTLTFSDSARCYNTTLYVLDRTVDPPVWRKRHVWNFNRDTTRVYVNETDSLVTIAIHNDDDLRVGFDYVSWSVHVTVTTSTSSDSSSADNPEVYGGFSLGGRDLLSSEFGDPPGPHVTVDAAPGCELSAVPRRLGAGVQQLTLNHPIVQWTPYWSHLEMRLAVAAVADSGVLQITCPSTGYAGSLPIGQPGVYVVDLGTTNPTNQFSITLGAGAGLDFELDAIGFAKLIQATSDAEPGPAPVMPGLWTLGANPLRESIAFRVDLSATSPVDLSVYDVAGRKVATLASGVWQAGSYPMTWSARDAGGRPVPNGLYFCRLVTSHGVWTARWTVIR